MRVSIVAMPWSSMSRPSAAGAALVAYLRQQEPSWQVTGSHAYMRLAEALGQRLYATISERCYNLGELVYLPLLYPENREPVLRHLAKGLATAAASPEDLMSGMRTWDEVAAGLVSAAEAHAATEVTRLQDANVVGLTTCFGQLFANVYLCRRLRASGSQARTVLGGSSVSYRAGPSILEEFQDVIDFVVQGEGELPLHRLIRGLEQGTDVAHLPSVLGAHNFRQYPDGVSMTEMRDLDDLPVPEYDEYAELARALGIMWSIPVEGSRGCWWDRVRKTTNAKDTCYFCNLNVQWNGYREKSTERVVTEVDALTSRYASGDLFFLDNIIRSRGLEEFARKLASLGKELRFFYEMRANVRPPQLLLLWMAGLRKVQFGIESLSSSLLQKVGKGTTVIQNLEAMKTCYELDISNEANLILNFPTASEEDVRETVHNIEWYAACWQPLSLSEFSLGAGSTVHTLPAEFGITNVRRNDSYSVGLPSKARRLNLLELSFDAVKGVDWSPVRRAQERWRVRHAELRKDETSRRARSLLEYEDGGDFLRIRDHRQGELVHVLRGGARSLYLYCCEIRTKHQVMSRFAKDDPHAEHAVRHCLQTLVDKRLMFSELNRYLSLAVARDTWAACNRILSAHPELKRDLPQSVIAFRTESDELHG